MVGYIVPYMEPPISPSTIMDSTTAAGAEGARPTVLEEAAEGRLHISGWQDWWFHIYGTIYPTISGSKNGFKIDNPSEGTIDYSGWTPVMNTAVHVHIPGNQALCRAIVVVLTGKWGKRNLKPV